MAYASVEVAAATGEWSSEIHRKLEEEKLLLENKIALAMLFVKGLFMLLLVIVLLYVLLAEAVGYYQEMSLAQHTEL